MKLNIDLTLSIWRTDNGYRTINSFLKKFMKKIEFGVLNVQRCKINIFFIIKT